MKRLIIILLSLSLSSLFALGVQSIRIEGHQDIACRLVIQLDEEVEPVIQKTGNGFYIAIPGLSGSLPAYNTDGQLIKSLRLEGSGVAVSTTGSLNYSRVILDNKKIAAYDLYISPSIKEKDKRLRLAKFHTEKGRYATADKMYNDLSIDYREHWDIQYYWGELLIKRGSDRAKAKLSSIPPGSSFYPKAQALLSSLGQSSQAEPIRETRKTIEEPKKPAEPEKPTEDFKDLDEFFDLKPNPTGDYEILEEPGIAVKDKAPIIDADERDHFLSSLAELVSGRFSLLIFSFVVLLIILILLIYVFKNNKKSVKKEVEVNSLNMDTATITRMVNKLLSDGWTNREIAKELKISLFEVEQAIKRLHYLGGLGESYQENDLPQGVIGDEEPLIQEEESPLPAKEEESPEPTIKEEEPPTDEPMEEPASYIHSFEEKTEPFVEEHITIDWEAYEKQLIAESEELERKKREQED